MLGRGRGLPDPFPVRAGDKLTPAAADFLKQRKIALSRSEQGGLADRALIPVGVSNRHVHLAPRHVEVLFGAGYELKPLRELSQSGQYAARETVTIVGPKGNIPGVRILGPARGETQVEISRTDSYRLECKRRFGCPVTSGDAGNHVNRNGWNGRSVRRLDRSAESPASLSRRREAASCRSRRSAYAADERRSVGLSSRRSSPESILGLHWTFISIRTRRIPRS